MEKLIQVEKGCQALKIVMFSFDRTLEEVVVKFTQVDVLCAAKTVHYWLLLLVNNESNVLLVQFEYFWDLVGVLEEYYMDQKREKYLDADENDALFGETMVFIVFKNHGNVQ